MEPQNDELRWIEAALTGDQQAFDRLVEHYQNAVYTLAHRLLGNSEEAADAAQEVFVRVYLRLASFDRSLRFSTWLLSIARNYCIDQLRRRRWRWLSLDDIAYWLPSTRLDPEEMALSNEARSTVHHALAQLPPNLREVTVLRYWNDLTYDEIAAVTGLTEANVKTRLHRARKKLAEVLEPGGAEEWSPKTSS